MAGIELCCTAPSPSELRASVSIVARLQLQPSANARHGPFSRSCHRAQRGESERTCSMNSSRPPGFRTRCTSRSAASGSGTVQRTSVETTVSNSSSANGSASAEASTTVAGRPRRATRSRIRSAIASSGSESTSSTSSR